MIRIEEQKVKVELYDYLALEKIHDFFYLYQDGKIKQEPLFRALYKFLETNEINIFLNDIYYLYIKICINSMTDYIPMPEEVFNLEIVYKTLLEQIEYEYELHFEYEDYITFLKILLNLLERYDGSFNLRKELKRKLSNNGIDAEMFDTVFVLIVRIIDTQNINTLINSIENELIELEGEIYL